MMMCRADFIQSHFTFMAGLSFLYAFFNLYNMGGGPGVPSIEEARMDIESCLAVLDYLAREFGFLSVLSALIP
jgi:hypothetical protein